MERAEFMTYNASSPLRAIETSLKPSTLSRLKQHTCNRHNKIFARFCLRRCFFLSWILYWHLLNASSTAYCEWSSLTLAASHQILSFVFLLFVCFPPFRTKHIVYGHSWNQSSDFLCCWWIMLVHSWLLHCTMTAESSLPAVVISWTEEVGVVMCSHSALDVPALLPRSVARMLPVITACFIAPVGTVLLEFFIILFGHSGTLQIIWAHWIKVLYIQYTI